MLLVHLNFNPITVGFSSFNHKTYQTIGYGVTSVNPNKVITSCHQCDTSKRTSERTKNTLKVAIMLLVYYKYFDVMYIHSILWVFMSVPDVWS